MKRKSAWLVLSCLTVLALILASCRAAPVVEGEKEVVKGKVVEKEAPKKVEEEEEEKVVVAKITGPQYGGTISYIESAEPVHFDPWYHSGRDDTTQSMWLEHLGILDWTVDREVLPLNFGGASLDYTVGLLAESWEEPDNETIIFHIRKGIHFHNKPPVNGREMTADDVAYSFNRLFGLGGYGFTEPSPYSVDPKVKSVTSVEATDRYTVVVKHTPSVDVLLGLLVNAIECYIIPREVVELYGDLEDWRNAVGTGPWMLDDFVGGSSLSFVKNPNYWRYDEAHPENRLPYADKLQMLIIPEVATRLAALRTGKLDVIGLGYAGAISWEQAASLKRTNPYLKTATILGMTQALVPRYGKEPFYPDIRVRKAMQMAIDIPTIANTYFGGYSGLTVPPLFDKPGAYTPFDELPEDVKEGYSYNPEKAKELLTEAGYPDGFKTSIICWDGGWSDVDLLLVAKEYLAKIDIDVEIKVYERAGFYGRMTSGEWDEDMTWWRYGGMPDANIGNMSWVAKGDLYWWNFARLDDPYVNERYDKLAVSVDLTEYDRLMKEANDHMYTQFLGIRMPRDVVCIVWNPWLGGYRGETFLGMYQVGAVFARLWVDQDLKYEMTGIRD